MSLSSAALSAGRATLRLWRSAAWRQGATFGSRRLQQAPLVAQAQQQAGRPQQQGGPGRRAASSAALPEPVAAAAAAAAPPVAAEQHTHLQPPPARQQQQQQQDSAAHGAIEIVVGPMFAGKSTELLRRVARYEAEGLCVAVVKSDKDDRYCAAHVVTHSGIKRVICKQGWACRLGCCCDCGAAMQARSCLPAASPGLLACLVTLPPTPRTLPLPLPSAALLCGAHPGGLQGGSRGSICRLPSDCGG